MSDTVARIHSTWLHFVKQPRYFSAVDEVRESYADRTEDRHARYLDRDDLVVGTYHRKTKSPITGGPSETHGILGLGYRPHNPLGKLPGSVWTMTEGEVVERIVKGWAPTHGICTACGEGRRPVVDRHPAPRDLADHHAPTKYKGTANSHNRKDGDRKFNGPDFNAWRDSNPETITGYACACSDATAPVTEVVVIDPFCTTRPH